MSDIFLSYAREDRDLALGIAEELQHKGWSVWWDREIELGKNFNKAIAESLSKARCVVVLWTQHSVESDYVQAEASTAQELGTLVPVVLQRGIELPLPFRMLQAADLTGVSQRDTEDAFDALFARIERVLDGPRQPVAKREPGPLPIVRRVARAPLYVIILLHLGVLVAGTALAYASVRFFGAPKLMIQILPSAYAIYLGLALILTSYLRRRAGEATRR